MSIKIKVYAAVARQSEGKISTINRWTFFTNDLESVLRDNRIERLDIWFTNKKYLTKEEESRPTLTFKTFYCECAMFLQRAGDNFNVKTYINRFKELCPIFKKVYTGLELKTENVLKALKEKGEYVPDHYCPCQILQDRGLFHPFWIQYQEQHDIKAPTDYAIQAYDIKNISSGLSLIKGLCTMLGFKLPEGHTMCTVLPKTVMSELEAVLNSKQQYTKEPVAFVQYLANIKAWPSIFCEKDFVVYVKTLLDATQATKE